MFHNDLKELYINKSIMTKSKTPVTYFDKTPTYYKISFKENFASSLLLRCSNIESTLTQIAQSFHS